MRDSTAHHDAYVMTPPADTITAPSEGPVATASAPMPPQSATICVRRWRWFFFWGRELVIDPSLCTTPVTKSEWKALQNNMNATLTDTEWTSYWQYGGTDPAYAQTNQHLATARLHLLNRSVGPFGPPPYANCP